MSAPRALLLLLIPALHGAPVAFAVELGGFAQVNTSVRTTGVPCDSGGPCDYLLEDMRLQLKLEGASEGARTDFLAKVDLFQDAIAGRSDLEVREAYVDLNGSHAALRAGRQIVTWGIGDLLFANDVFPKDWIAFFTGRPLEYLKIGSDAMKLDLHPGPVDAAIVLMPVFQPDRYPTPDRLTLPDPFPGVPRREERPERSFENTELAGRLSRSVSDWTVAAYASRTFQRSPSDSLAGAGEVRLFYPRLRVYGASATGSFHGTVLGLEGAYLDSRDDRNGSNPWILNSTVKGIAAVTHSPWRDATLGLQGYVEWTLDYDAYRAGLPAIVPARDERRWVATLRLSQLLRHQTVTAGVFAFWGVTDRDGYVIPSVRYAATDNLWIEGGGNVFVGEHAYTMFGSLDLNDNVYAVLRYGF